METFRSERDIDLFRFLENLDRIERSANQEPGTFPSVKYLDESEKRIYKIRFVNGSIQFVHPTPRFIFSSPTDSQRESRFIQQTIRSHRGELIFVLDGENNFYAGIKERNRFHHSSFLGGGFVKGAGTMYVENSVVKIINNLSGHYQPGLQQMENVIDAIRRPPNRGNNHNRIAFEHIGGAGVQRYNPFTSEWF